MLYCMNCEKMVTPKKELNWLAFIILLVISFWALGIFGWIYLLMHAVKKPVCPMCNSENWGSPPNKKKK